MGVAPTFFPDPAAFRRWLAQHHASATELWVGFWKRDSGEPSITWPESVEQALCYGWIDGVRKTIDEKSYRIRFTPRRAGSNWSRVNLKTAAALIERGLMQPAGMAAYEKRRGPPADTYSFERTDVAFPAPLERELRKNAAAWRFFADQPPGYRKVATWYVISAKKEETRLRRLARLIEDSAAGRRIGMLDNTRYRAKSPKPVKKPRRGSS